VRDGWRWALAQTLATFVVPTQLAGANPPAIRLASTSVADGAFAARPRDMEGPRSAAQNHPLGSLAGGALACPLPASVTSTGVRAKV